MKWLHTAFLAVLCSLSLSGAVHALSGTGEVDLASLPPEVAHTLTLIQQGGPFPYRKDGSIFGNREGRLPEQPRGYYREYTVPTPGATNRGARRIVAGSGPRRDVRRSGEYYYTPDHYRSFKRIRPVPPSLR